jgi:hypothetical protein
MLFDPTPRMLVHDLYRLEEERSQAHERVIQAIVCNVNVAPYEQEREAIKEELQVIRSSIRRSH